MPIKYYLYQILATILGVFSYYMALYQDNWIVGYSLLSIICFMHAKVSWTIGKMREINILIKKAGQDLIDFQKKDDDYRYTSMSDARKEHTLRSKRLVDISNSIDNIKSKKNALKPMFFERFFGI